MDWLRTNGRRAALFLVAVLSYRSLALPAHDPDFPCTEKTQAEKYVQDLHIDVESFGGLELCNSQSDLKKLFNDLDLVENGEFQNQGDNIFIREWIPAHEYYPWLVDQTRSVERSDDIPWAVAFNSFGHFTMQEGWSRLTTAARVGVLLHEARHTEGYSHIPCDHGPYKDSDIPACDSHVQAGGSHAVEMEYYARVQTQGANFHPVFKAMARLMLQARANFVFNENPLSPRDTLVARTTAGLYKLDELGGKPLSYEVSGPFVQLKRSSLGLTLFESPGHAWAVDFGDKTSITVPDDYSYFRLLSRLSAGDLRDVEEMDLAGRRYIFAMTEDQQVATFHFADGAWSEAVPFPQLENFLTVDPAGRSGFFGRLEGSRFCEIEPARPHSCSKTPEAWPLNTIKFVNFRNLLLRLGTDHKVYDSQGRLWPALKDFEVFDLVTIPDYGVFN